MVLQIQKNHCCSIDINLYYGDVYALGITVNKPFTDKENADRIKSKLTSPEYVVDESEVFKDINTPRLAKQVDESTE